MTPNIEKLHPLVMAYLKVLEAIQGAATQGKWWLDDVQGTAVADLRQLVLRHGAHSHAQVPGTSTQLLVLNEPEKLKQARDTMQAIAAAHNTHPALLAIAKGALEWHYGCSKALDERMGENADEMESLLDKDGFTDRNELYEELETIGCDLANDATHHDLEHHAICQQLASDGHECEQLQALKEALSE